MIDFGPLGGTAFDDLLGGLTAGQFGGVGAAPGGARGAGGLQSQQHFQLFQQAGAQPSGMAAALASAPSAPPPAANNGGGSAAALAAALGASGHGSNSTNVAAAAIASLPAVSIYFDEVRACSRVRSVFPRPVCERIVFSLLP